MVSGKYIIVNESRNDTEHPTPYPDELVNICPKTAEYLCTSCAQVALVTRGVHGW